MDATNIALWTTSLTLAVIGITFAFRASYSATKANEQIKTIIETSWIQNEVRYYFFNQIKVAIDENKTIISLLKTPQVKFNKYGKLASKTRLVPLHPKVLKVIKDNEFKDIADIYTSSKKIFDEGFSDLIGNYSLLSTDSNISDVMKAKLLEYHTGLSHVFLSIIKSYSNISSSAI